MKLTTYKDFKKDYEYDLLSEISILKNVQFKTFNSKTKSDAKKSLSRIINTRRPKKDRELIIKVEYIQYLENHLIPDVRNFDKLYKLIEKKK